MILLYISLSSVSASDINNFNDLDFNNNICIVNSANDDSVNFKGFNSESIDRNDNNIQNVSKNMEILKSEESFSLSNENNLNNCSSSVSSAAVSYLGDVDSISNESIISYRDGGSSVSNLSKTYGNLSNASSSSMSSNNTVKVYVSIKDILSTSSKLKSYAEKHGKLPQTVVVGKKTVNLAQFLYLMAVAVKKIDAKKYNSKIAILKIKNPSKSQGSNIQSKLYKKNYLKLTKSLVDYIQKKKVAPIYLKSSLGKIQFNTLIYIYSKILNGYKSKKSLVNYVFVFDITEDYKFRIKAKPSIKSSYSYKWYATTFKNYCPLCHNYGSLTDNPKGVYEHEITCCLCDSDYCGVTGCDKSHSRRAYLTKLSESTPCSEVTTLKEGSHLKKTYNFSVKEIVSVASSLKSYVKNHKKLPSTIRIKGVKINAAQFSYLAGVAIDKINSKKINSKIDLISVSNSKINSYKTKKTVKKLDYITTSKNVIKFINNNRRTPNYVTVSNKRFSYYAFETFCVNILDYYNNYKKLPKSISFNS
ncbi:MAG: hypothetical protein MJ232_08850 [archaeon]|nr:hypothetical protein [archaeon]